jgi:MFS transporter, ACS family, aldohexuronate transporter
VGSQYSTGARRLPGESVLLLGILLLGYAVYATDRLVLSAVLKPMALSLGLSDLEKGFLSSAQYVGVAAVVFVAGSLSDRYGARRIVLAGVVIFTAFTWLIAFSSNFYEAFALRLVSGLGEGLFWPVAMAWLANCFGARKGFALGVFYVGFDAGQILGLFVGGATYGYTGDWRTAFLVAPVFGLAVIAGLTLVGPSIASVGRGPETVSLGREAVQLLKNRRTVLLMVFALLATWATVWEVVFLPYYYGTVLGASVRYAAFLAAALPAAGAFGKVLLGTLSDFLRRDRMLALTSAGVVILYAIFFSTNSILVGGITSVAMGFLGASIFPIVQSLMAESSGGFTGTGLGLTTSAQSVATVFAPTITGYLFYIGVGRAIALDAMVPAAAMLAVAIALGLTGGKGVSKPPSNP